MPLLARIKELTLSETLSILAVTLLPLAMAIYLLSHLW